MNVWIQRWRMATSPWRVFPDFIIPGETKCGTTSLYHYLTQHPRIRSALVKEPNNFINYGGSPLLCRMNYIFRWEQLARRAITGEASAEYFSKSGVAEVISKLLPNAKIIILLRDPIARAFSDHQMFFKDGRERVPFAETVRRSVAWLSDPSLEPLVDAAGRPNHNPIRYVGRGIYLPSLRRWQACFPPEQVLVMKSEDLFDDPQSTTERVFQFLGLSPRPLRDVSVRKKGSYAEKMDAETRGSLAAFYRPHNEALYAHLGRNFGWEQEWTLRPPEVLSA